MVQIPVMCECGHLLKKAAMNRFGSIETTPCEVCMHDAFERGYREGDEHSDTLLEEAIEEVDSLKEKIKKKVDVIVLLNKRIDSL